MTSNQHYKGLNNRFEKRSAILRRLGFSYVRVAELNIAVFTRRRPGGKVQTIPACFLHLADKRTWIDELAVALVRH